MNPPAARSTICTGTVVCSQCGDALIHRSNRQRGESSSAYGQHIHDRYEVAFYAADIDIAISHGGPGGQLLRVIEQKRPGGVLTRGQRIMLPMLAVGISTLKQVRYLHPESGVFLLNATPPWQSITVSEVLPDVRTTMGEPRLYDGPRMVAFETGRPLDTPVAELMRLVRT